MNTFKRVRGGDLSTTNGDQLQYRKPADREPMLSDDAMFMNQTHYRPTFPHDFVIYADAYAVRDFYEAKITSGELITKEEHERLLQEASENPPMLIDPTSGR